jgi:hypothetical protein
VPCKPGTFDFQLASAQLMFVIDRSGSMDYELAADRKPQPGQPTRWQALHDSLSAAIVPLDKQLQTGAKFFPEVDLDVVGCNTMSGVGIAPALGNASTILSVFDTTSPNGGTPTAQALTFAGQFLTTTRGVVRTMVLATDGEPNCNGALDGRTCVCTAPPGYDCATLMDGQYDCLDDVATEGAINDLYVNRKIPTYVIGIGPQSFSYVLDAMAVSGGRPRATSPRYYPAQSPADLTTAFSAVRDSVTKCTYLTPSAPTDPDSIVVVVSGTPVVRDTAHMNGWDWVDQEYGELELFGDACNTATANNVSGTITCRDD